VVYDNRLGDTSVISNINLDAQGYVARYHKDEGADLVYVEAGVLGFRRSVVDRIEPGTAVSLEKEVFPRLISGRTLIGFPTRERFYDIGTPERLRALEERLGR
jgi:mannose-1-phosphate guanylyltransferase